MSNNDIGWLDNVHDQLGILRNDAYHLKDLAEAFRIVGSDKTAQALEAIADELLIAQNEIGGNIGKMLSDQVDKGNKELGNIVKAVLTKAIS